MVHCMHHPAVASTSEESETSLQILLRWDNDGNDASFEHDHADGCDDGGGGCDGDSIGNDYAV